MSQLVDILLFEGQRPLPPSPDRHSWHELIVPVRAGYRIDLDGALLRPLPATAVGVPAGVQHRPGVEGNGLFFCLQWHGEAPPRGLIADPASRLLPLCHELHHRRARMAVDDPRCCSVLAVLLEALVDLDVDASEGPLARAKAYLERHLDQPGMSMDEVARVAGLTRAHFTRAFRAIYGMPPAAWRRRLRLAAADRLAAAGVARDAIARQVGFATAGNLARAQRSGRRS